MDLSSINKTNRIKDNGVSFQGQKAIKSNKGEKMIRIYPPYIELHDGEELGIECVTMSEVKNSTLPYNWRISSDPIEIETDDDFKKGKKTYFDVDLDEYWLGDEGEFGYRFVVKDSKTQEVKRAYTDSIGSPIKEGDLEFTVASSRQGTPPSAGPMEHIFTDSYNLTKQMSKGLLGNQIDERIGAEKRNHVNRMGGTIQGIIDKLNNELSSSKYIMTTPLIGGGITSSHMYHPANHFKPSTGTGNKNDFLNLQLECFKQGKGYVLDGAFTSQGYEGLQFNHALKWEDSPFKYWFKNPGEDGFQLGVLPDKDLKHTGIRIVNPKNVEGYNYDPKMPTYIQFYDTRLASKEQLSEYGKLIEKYDNTNPEDPYEISTWHDGTLNNYFEVDPAKFSGKTFGSVEDWNDKGQLNEILNPTGQSYSYGRRGEVSGTTGWDGNIDLVKMNLSNHANSEKMVEGSKQAKNYMYNIARYWTEETRNAIITDVAREVNKKKSYGYNDEEGITTRPCREYLEKIEKTYSLEKGSLSKIYKRILSEKDARLYESHKFEKSYNYNIHDDKRDGTTFLKEEMLNFPMESLGFSPELLSILSTPFITPRPSAKGNPAGSKTEIFNDAKNNTELSSVMKEVYTNQLPAAIKNILMDLQQEYTNAQGIKDSDYSKLIFTPNGDGVGNFTPYGKYFVEMAMDDIMEFVMTEALFGDDAYPEYPGGSLSFKCPDSKEGTGCPLTLNRLGVNEGDAKQEAEAVARKIRKGLEDLPKKLADTKSVEYVEFKKYLTSKYYTMDLEDYKLAEAITDQTSAGLNWRFDAAKDVADWDEVRGGELSSESAWNDVIDFWKPFVGEIRKYNPASYIVAEVTSLSEFDKYNWGDRFGDSNKAEKVYYEETGATTGSNYSTFFGAYPKLFGRNIEDGEISQYRSVKEFMSAADKFLNPETNSETGGFVPPEFIQMSQVFIDNHDKPRGAHLMAVDGKLFWSNFKKGNIAEYKLKAEKVLDREFSDDMNSKAVAVAEKYLEYFNSTAKELGMSASEVQILDKAIRHLANGYKFKSASDRTPNYEKADAFGSTPYENTIWHVIQQAQTMGLKIDGSKKELLFDGVRKNMVAPYESRMIPLYELMNGMVGVPTLFAGDEFAQTGSETVSKNWSLGPRGVVRHDWITNNKKQDVVDFNKRIKQIASLSKKPGMSALTDGTPIVTQVTTKEYPKKYTYHKDILNVPKEEIQIRMPKICDSTDNIKKIFSFVEGIDKMSDEKAKDAMYKVLNTMSESELQETLSKSFEHIGQINSGLADWIINNFDGYMSGSPSANLETGAVYKYNEKGDAVITVMTNAFMPADNDVAKTLLDEAKIGAPNISDVTLKDSKGNLVAKPGTTFVRKAYDEKTGDYVDDGVFILSKDGKLLPKDGSSSVLKSTVTYFAKEKPIYNSHVKTVG